jgi:predicted DCC family thiol-disulfide oxidoreductase YuxK
MILDPHDAAAERERALAIRLGQTMANATAPVPTPPPDAMADDVGTLTVYTDERCGFCDWCRQWLRAQPLLVPVQFAPAGGEEARRRLGALAASDDLVVQADDGRVWAGGGAFILCLWATERHRDLARTLRMPVVRMSAERFFRSLSSNRDVMARFFPPTPVAAPVRR